MKHYKKRTIALVLASVVTVVGAFGAENFRNSLMSLDFKGDSNGAVEMILHTKRSYDRTVSPVKKDANTYVIMLPEINSEVMENNGLGDINAAGIDSVDIKTMPYTTSSKGYTKITLKTSPDIRLSAKSILYIEKKPDENQEGQAQQTQPNKYTQQPQTRQQVSNTYQAPNNYQPTSQLEQRQTRTKPPVQTQTAQSNNIAPAQTNAPETNVMPTTPPNDFSSESVISDTDNSMEVILLALGILFVFSASVYIFITQKNKIADIIGEQPDFEIDDEKKDKKSKTKKIRKTIQSLDKMYQKPVKMPVHSEIMPEVPQTPEPLNVVDLDELFQEKNKVEEPVENIDEPIVAEEENDALNDFLNAFFTPEENNENEEEDKSLYNEELFNELIGNDNLRFTKDDMSCINQLLNSEINDDTLRNIEKYLVSNPIETPKRTKQETLERFVTDFAIKQNVTFTGKDIEALNKLISIEITPDFLADLRMNPDMIQVKKKEFEEVTEVSHKAEEIKTLNVHDLLPDLSKALKKQGNRQIESEVVPEIVYYSEGYEVSKLSVDSDMPDLSKEVNNKQAYVSKPSAQVEYSAEGYEFEKMTDLEGIPDLADVLKNPEKYDNEKPEPEKADEDSLLKSISNVQMKPFYDGETEFDIVNKFEPEPEPEIEDLKAVSDADELISLLSDEEKEDSKDENVEMIIPHKYDKKTVKTHKKRSEDAEKLLQLIQEKKQTKRLERESRLPSVGPIEPLKTEKEILEENAIKYCEINGEEYEILYDISFTASSGCCLARKDDTYCICGHIITRTFPLKFYKSSRPAAFSARKSENFPDGSSRYLVRFGVHKCVINVSPDKMEYVMDLC